MNKWTFSLAIITLSLAGITWLVSHTLEEKSLIGAYILGLLSAVLIMTVDWIKTNITVWLRDRQYNHQFQDNVKENLVIATQAQKLQNEQLKAQNQLVVSNNENIGLLFDHSEIGG